MTTSSLAKTNAINAVLSYWRKTTGYVYDAFLITRDGKPSYRVKSAAGIWYLQPQAPDTTEEELSQANAFFQEMQPIACPLLLSFIKNDVGQIGTRAAGQCWTLSPLSPKTVFSTAWLAEELTENMTDGAAEALALIHAHGFHHIRRRGLPCGSQLELTKVVEQHNRFNRLGQVIYGYLSDYIDPKGREALRFFQQLVPQFASDSGTDRAFLIDNVASLDTLSDHQEEKLSDADIAWMGPGMRGSLPWRSLCHRFHITVTLLRQEERQLGFPRTIVHGSFAMNNLQFDDGKLAHITGWQGFQAMSPLYDLAYAGIMLSVKWSHPPRPCDAYDVGAFDQEKFGRFATRYNECMLGLCGDDVMDSSFGAAIESPSLLHNYMRAACYRILMEQLEDLASGNSNFDLHRRVFTQILHVERLLWL